MITNKSNLTSSQKILIHTKTLKVLFGDMDAYGHVNNTNYFLYAQEARFDILTEHNYSIDAKKIAPILAYTTCKYIKPIIYPEEIIIETYYTGNEGKKTFFQHIIKSNKTPDLLYAIIEASIIWYDFEKKASIDNPNYIIELLSEKIMS